MARICRQFRNASGDCMECEDENCQVCSDETQSSDGPSECQLCDSGFLLYKGDCVMECPANTYQRRSREGQNECFE